MTCVVLLVSYPVLRRWKLVYSEDVLDIVGASVDIYQRAPENQQPRIPKRGHFQCTDCMSRPMGAQPRYFTGSLVDFEYTDEPMFNFLFSPHDLYYRERRDKGSSAIRRLARARHLDWTYMNASDIDGWELHVRGWWDGNDEFIHNTGMLDLGDHVDLDFDVEDEDRELAIQVYTPAQTGMYVHWRNASIVQDWNAENRFEKTFVHPSMDQFIRIEMPLWNKRALPRGTKKKKKPAETVRMSTWSQILRERGNIPMEEMPDEFETELDDF